jgi:hypothetical protein
VGRAEKRKSYKRARVLVGAWKVETVRLDSPADCKVEPEEMQESAEYRSTQSRKRRQYNNSVREIAYNLLNRCVPNGMRGGVRGRPPN